ncbi:MAG: molybdopterin molybdotransferase MoeA [Synergistaceae bacterium]|jgi:molybdopterin molybdotransferase|nr:molybdopterin molybdotransferase MoeA [Synergistaceae bacterium]
MADFVEEVRPIDECVNFVADSLSFPWKVRERKVDLCAALFMRSSRDVRAGEPSPPFTRSLRDGYALSHSITTGASPGSPIFLKVRGEVVMGEAPTFALFADEAAFIPTGGMVPDGADAVVMLEDTEAAGGVVELRRAVQRGENLIFIGEEIAPGDILLSAGEMIDCSIPGILGTFGIFSVDVVDLKIGVISTGDEILPIDASPLPIGSIRDANTYSVQSLLRRYGWASRSYGIAPDNPEDLTALANEAIGECDVVLLSGGSSVGARDHTARILDSLSEPGPLIHGINMTPGKPTLIGGSISDKKLIVGLPGHPLSCMVSTIFVVMPILLAMSGARGSHVGRYLKMRLAEDVQGRTGPDELIPMKISEEGAAPLAAKSSYVSAMRGADGFIRLRPNTETLRKYDETEIWLW